MITAFVGAVMISASSARATPPPARYASVDLRAATALIVRVVPSGARFFSVAAIAPDSAGDVFEVESEQGRIVLRGSSGVAIASALNWYLEHVAGVNIDAPLRVLRLPLPLSPVTQRVRVVTPHRIRYFFNYCTFSYSMAWWGWPEWQRMIDWMALKGINTPLAATGQEGTWRLTLRDMGFSEAQIAAFLVGPAYLPWGWMGNIDGLGGPLPASWVDSHVALERQILARERSLGMQPVLQGFTGHVPESIKAVFPAARIHRTGDWSAGFPGTWFLDPLDPLFQRFGQTFLKRQTELFGTDHYYAADSFNEIDPPSNDSTFLAGMGRAVYESMHTVDTSAVWVLQGWFLYYQAKFWQPLQARALLGAVPDDRMLVLDLYGDQHPVWRSRQAFYGKPWIWNVLYNFGGKSSLNGDLPRIAANLADAESSTEHGKLRGVGMMMEGLGTNPIVPDFVMDMNWRSDVPAIESWTRAYVDRRYRSTNADAWSAWQILLQTAYRSAAQSGTFLAERPGFYVQKTAYRTEPVLPYDGKRLTTALELLLRASNSLGRNDSYRYDVVNLARQVFDQLGVPFVGAVQRAFEHGDQLALATAESRVLELLADMDRLVGTRREFLLGPWLADARRWGRTKAEQDLYEWNARNIITLWGTKCTEGENDDLNLYAYKEWQGMFASYYRPRWQRFFDTLNESLAQHGAFDRRPFATASCEWEQRWSAGHEQFARDPSGDGVAIARALLTKYRRELGN